MFNPDSELNILKIAYIALNSKGAVDIPLLLFLCSIGLRRRKRGSYAVYRYEMGKKGFLRSIGLNIG